VDDTISERPLRRPLEGRIRRSLELFFLGVTLLVGLGVVGGCGGAALIFAQESGPLIVAALIAGGVALVGVVYLATSMSRDVRMLRAKLEEQERNRRH
jgi:amino acid transporter